MKIEEARKTIEELLNSNEPICEYMLKHQEIEAMQKLLNELDKKDKVIDMMAEQIRASDIDEDICKLITEPTECVSRDCKCENCIKEYFYNKVEIPEKN